MELRERRARPSYAALFELDSEFDSEAEAGPSTKRKRMAGPLSSDEESDDYNPGVAASPEDDEDVPMPDAEEEVEDEEEDGGEDDEYDEDIDEAVSRSPSKAAIGGLIFKPKPRATDTGPKRVPLARLAPSDPSGNTATHQSKYSSRLRPTSLFFPPDPRRLTAPSQPFARSEDMPTTFSGQKGILRRTARAWASASSHGPPWELLEDRGWFCEGYREGAEGRRPTVYQDVLVGGQGVQRLGRNDALPYLPVDVTPNEDGSPKPPAPVECYFGPFPNQTKTSVEMYEAVKLGTYLPGSTSHVFNAGGPVWGLDWCPLQEKEFEDKPLKHYLAVGTLPSAADEPYVGSRTMRPSPASIQIWSLSPDVSGKAAAKNDAGKVQCELVMCIDTGPAWELKWCPLPASDAKPIPGGQRKIGLLAGAFRDGAVSIFAVPHPLDFKGGKKKAGEPIYVKLSEPVARLTVDDAACICLDWANSERIAVGCSNGFVAVFDVGRILRSNGDGDPSASLPTQYFPVHQSAIRSVAWIRAPPYDADGVVRPDWHPIQIASASYDGGHMVTDIREPFSAQIDRIRDFVSAVAFSPFSGGPVFTDQGFAVKHVSLGVVNLGRGRAVLDACGPIWDISTSDYHHNVAVASSDGCVQLGTTARHLNKAVTANFVHPLYQIDYNRKTGEYRMLDRLLPREMRETQQNFSRNKQKRGEQDEDPLLTAHAAWPPNVGVHRVAWHSGAGLGRAPLLTSGTASGLCRVDWLQGRFVKDKFPWGRIEVLRGEVEGVEEDVDMDEEDDD